MINQFVSLCVAYIFVWRMESWRTYSFYNHFSSYYSTTDVAWQSRQQRHGFPRLNVAHVASCEPLECTLTS